MIQITYSNLLLLISIVWCALRGALALKSKQISWKREAQLLLVYICIVVVARFTFFPFSKVNGEIQPLVFDSARVFPFRINWIPFVNLLDYPEKREILLNVIGNTTMFIPLGVVWPSVFKALNTHSKVIAAGFGCSLCIEILQLPFPDRVTDVDDLLLNTAGFIAGYLVFLLAKAIASKMRCRRGR